MRGSLKKKGCELPMKVGAFSYESQSDMKNMLKTFEMRYHLEMYEMDRPMFDPKGYAREVLQIGGMVKHITTIEDYWANYRDEFKSRDRDFSRLYN